MELKAGRIVTVDWRKDPGDPELAIPDLTVVLQPSATNGFKKVSDLFPQNLTCVAKTRITTATDSCVTPSSFSTWQRFQSLATMSWVWL